MKFATIFLTLFFTVFAFSSDKSECYATCSMFDDQRLIESTGAGEANSEGHARAEAIEECRFDLEVQAGFAVDLDEMDIDSIRCAVRND